MKNLRENCTQNIKLLIGLFFLLIFTQQAHSENIDIEIQGNNYTDTEVILSLIENLPENLSEDYSNYLIKTLDNSKLFENVIVKIDDDKFIIIISEFPNLNNIIFENNERLKDEELYEFINEYNLINLNPLTIDGFILELEKVYHSFGYNNINITYSSVINKKNNTADLVFNIAEGKITKIRNIIFLGNKKFDTAQLKNVINSKTKTLRNIFANNNFKKFNAENDTRLLSDFYRDNGYIETDISYTAEYLKNNRVDLYFNINEGRLFNVKSFKLNDNENILNDVLIEKINNKIYESYPDKNYYSLEKINTLKKEITNIIIDSDINFFEIQLLEKIENTDVDILFNISPVKPNYINQIKINGNTRTFDNVIRRELDVAEGDAVYNSQIINIKNKLSSLRLFNTVEVKEKYLENNLVNLIINVEEKQTGTVNAGVSVGTIDGFAVVLGLSERNFYGTGRSVKALLNTSEDSNEFTFELTDRLKNEDDVDITYKINLLEQDFSKSSSYNLDTFNTGIGIGYDLSTKLRHNINLDYVIKDYQITDTNTVASSIQSSSGQNISLILDNSILYSTLNSYYMPKNGLYFNYTNIIETPTSSNNGLIKNIITFKNFKNINKNIFSFQSRIGNILSLNNNEILSNDKFSLGGKWLRGFDNYGAGPRNSRTSYIGGNNLIVTKFDYSREITEYSDFPIYFNIFNDYGLLWENKTKPTNSDQSLRSSAGFGIKYYSPIGPIGFSWGFPLTDKEYDIKRMFLFSVGNID